MTRNTSTFVSLSVHLILHTYMNSLKENQNWSEPWHIKTLHKCHVRPVKTQICPCICAVWSQFSLTTGSSFSPRLPKACPVVWVFTQCTSCFMFVWSCQFISETVALSISPSQLLKHWVRIIRTCSDEQLFASEPPRYKTNKMTVRPAKTQISLGIRPVW